MKYTYREGVKKQTSRRWLIVPLIGVAGGLYMLLNFFAPEVLYVVQPADTTAKKLIAEQPTKNENRVYIPKINVDVAIIPVDGDEARALEQGAIHRSVNSGDPKSGGNYVIAAQRFNLGLTPRQTHANSPFYHLGKLNADDDIYVDYQGTRYAYKVVERKSVSATDVEIEKRTDQDRMTLYASELSGSGNQREVVVAKPVGRVIWSNGQPKLQPLLPTD